MSLAALFALTARGAAAAALPHVTVITDSVGGSLLWEPGAHAILGDGFTLDVEAEVCRKLASPSCENAPESALDTIDRLGPALGDTVVLDVGYNDTPDSFAAGIDPVMTALVANGVRHVIWVTLVEHRPDWAELNAELVAATGRWPELQLADWNAVALRHDEWFLDEAHMNSYGAQALATFLHPFLVVACGAACVPPTAFCGLARTVNGFDYVQATGLGCAAARTIAAAIERNDRGLWACSRNVGGQIELTCVRNDERIELLERSPVPATVGPAGVVTLANWSFRLHGRTIEARQNRLGWVSLGPPPWCIPDVPREVLLALQLKAVTADGGCFITSNT